MQTMKIRRELRNKARRVNKMSGKVRKMMRNKIIKIKEKILTKREYRNRRGMIKIH